MTTVSSLPRPAFDAAVHSGPRHPHLDFDAAGADDFTQLMSGYQAAAAPAPNGPSALSELVRVPARAYTEGLAAAQRPPPEGMTVMQTMEFNVGKQMRLNEAKTVYNMAGIALRMLRKDIETVLNNK